MKTVNKQVNYRDLFESHNKKNFIIKNTNN